MMRVMARLMPILILLATPVLALADDAPLIDGRLQGYRVTVNTPIGSTALTWLLLIGLGVVCAGVMFMSAKRSHLD
jgi:hypothetical protein